MPEIKIENLSFAYQTKQNTRHILNDISLVIPDKTFNVILGPSGIGKTTFLRCLMGALDYKGNIYFGDKLTDELSLNEMKLSYVSQSYNLYPHMTIFENIAFPLKLIEASREEIESRVNEIAESLGISACLTRKPKQISGGQQQRTALARALIKLPKLLLLDEPLSNVDIREKDTILKLLKELQMKNEMTVIYVTHNEFEAHKLGDNIYLLEDEKIKEIKKSK